MASEVFSQQTPVIQKFLLLTSVCNEFDAELGDLLADVVDSASLLEDLESRGVFVTRLEGPHSWYRYHHLFRDFLRDKLGKEDAEQLRETHVKAAHHYAARGDSRQAIHHYIQGGDHESALNLLEEQAEPLSQEGLWETIGNWLEQIPAEHRATKPRLILYLAQVYQRFGRSDEAIKLLNDAIEIFHGTDERVLEARALMHRSIAFRQKGALQLAVRDTRRALGLAREYGSALDEAEARSHLGSAYGQQGRFPRAARELRAALRGYQELGNLYHLSQVHKSLGSVYAQLGDLSKAGAHFELARQGWQELGNQSQLAITLNNMSVLYFQQGQYESAQPLAEESISLAQSTGGLRDEAYAHMSLADIQRERGDYSAALGSYERSMEIARECMETPLLTYGAFGAGETYRLTGDVGRARAFLKEALAFANDLDQDFERGLVYTSLGIIEYESRNYKEGLGFLELACDLLARSKQRRDLARARLHLGQVLFLQKRYTDALKQLQAVAEICEELGHDRFLLADVRRIPMLVQYAASRGNNKAFFNRISKPAIEAAPSALPRPAAQGAAVAPPRVEVVTFGATSITLDGSRILNSAWGSAKAREMFLFSLHKRQPLLKEKIVEALWPEIQSSKANSNFHSTLYRMKSGLNPNCVYRDGETYQLNPAWDYWVDAEGFDRMIQEAEGQAEGSPEAERLLASAIELYKGPYLEDIDSEWCDVLRTDFEFKFLKAVSSLAKCYEARGDHRNSIALLEKALEVDDLQEELYYRIMDLYMEIGDSISATAVHKRCTSILGETAPASAPHRVKRLLSHLN